MSKRVSPTGRLRAAIDELFGSDRDLASILEDVARISVRLLMQTALEAEVDAFLGRERYQRRDEKGNRCPLPGILEMLQEQEFGEGANDADDQGDEEELSANSGQQSAPFSE